MNIRFDFIIHWLWTIVFAILLLSGLAMVGAKYGWVLNYDIALADYTHRFFSAVFVLLTFISVTFEVIRGIKNDEKKQPWFVIGKNGYQLFTFITTLIFIITGVIIWVCMGSDMKITAYALYVHEKLTYIVAISVIWHVYEKSHALTLQTKKKTGQNEKKPV